MSKPVISIYGTVYNNVRTIRTCITSLAKALQATGISWEVVVVDNFSNDGTYEALVELSSLYPIRCIREKCSRGKGRDIALRHTRGDYVMYIDFDKYFTEEFGKLVTGLLKICKQNEVYTPYGFSLRETTIRFGGWVDLNHGEDAEFFARSCVKGVVRRVLTPPFSLEEPVHLLRRRGRYVKSKLSFYRRLLRDRLDSFRGCSSSYRHLREVHIANSRNLRAKLVKCLLYLLSRLLGQYKYSKYLRNNELVLYRERYVLPDDIGFPRDYLYFICYLDTLSDLGLKILIKKLEGIVSECLKRGYEGIRIQVSARSRVMYLTYLNPERVLPYINYTEIIRSVYRGSTWYSIVLMFR
ncbi:MAG: hypothetical protein DRJ40_00765 [Thermoprotei archaeon]|nr:MAG: hypothetical protein DRJ40_00765 [Thermoprotei archaeon]